MKEIFDAGGYDPNWNPMIDVVNELVKAGAAARGELYAVLLFLVRDEVGGIAISTASDSLRDLSTRTEHLLDVQAGSVDHWNALARDMRAVDWNARVLDPADADKSWSEHQAYSTLALVVDGGVALARGEYSQDNYYQSLAHFIGQATLNAGGFHADRYRALNWPQSPAAALYDDRVKEIRAHEDATAQVWRNADDLKRDAHQRQRDAFSRLLSQYRARQVSADANSAWRSVVFEFLQRWRRALLETPPSGGTEY